MPSSLGNEAIDAGVSSGSVPAMAACLVEPTLGLHTVDVGEHPYPIKVAVIVVQV
jgi:hypothetical protein